MWRRGLMRMRMSRRRSCGAWRLRGRGNQLAEAAAFNALDRDQADHNDPVRPVLFAADGRHLPGTGLHHGNQQRAVGDRGARHGPVHIRGGVDEVLTVTRDERGGGSPAEAPGPAARAGRAAAGAGAERQARRGVVGCGERCGVDAGIGVFPETRARRVSYRRCHCQKDMEK